METSERFDIRFSLDALRPEHTFRMHGAGSLEIEPDFVTVEGRRHRPFMRGPLETHRLRMVDIVNVRTDGATVAFDIQGVNGNRTLRFRPASADQGERIMRLLPARVTDVFVTARADQETFVTQIAHRAPWVPVMWILVAINVAVFLAMMAEGTPETPMARSEQLVRWGSNAGRLTLAGEWWRLGSSMFLHGSWLHILLNMFVLLQVGSLVERMFGSLRFAFLYLVAGLAGSLASVMWNPWVNSVGASGAIFGTIGALLAFIRKPDSGVPGTIVTELRGSISTFLLFNIVAGLVYPHTDNAAHLGGLAGGYLMGWLLARPLHLPQR